jgi:ABC-2 type transport system permease protein
MTAPVPSPAPVAPPAPPRSLRSPRLGVLVAFTLRSCLPPKRRLAVLVPCLGAILFGLLARAVDVPLEEAFANVAAEGILGLAMPIAALMIGDAVLGAEIRAGTFHVTWLSPVPAWSIVLGRWIGGCIAVLLTIVPAAAIAALVAGVPSAAGPLAAASAAGGIAYVAVFVAIGAITRRTAVWSLAFVFLVERLLGAALTGIAQLSPTWESTAVFAAWFHATPERLIRDGIPQGGAAIVRLAFVAAVALAIAAWRLRHLRLTGAAD